MKTKPVILLAAISAFALGASAQEAQPGGGSPNVQVPGSGGGQDNRRGAGDQGNQRPQVERRDDQRDGQNREQARDNRGNQDGNRDGANRGGGNQDGRRNDGERRDGADNRGAGDNRGFNRGGGDNRAGVDNRRDGDNRKDGDRKDGDRKDGDRKDGDKRVTAERRDGEACPNCDKRDGEKRGDGDKRDGVSKRDGNKDGGRHEWDHRKVEIRKEPRAFLGVMTGPMPPALTAQLGLKSGFGLVVLDVMGNSPAGKAGLKKFDVLTMLNDQQLVDQGQLLTLVTSLGKGTPISLTFFRLGKDQTVMATLEERVMPVPGGSGGEHRHTGMNEEGERTRGFGGLPPAFERPFENAQNGVRQIEERVRGTQEHVQGEVQNRMREMQERLRGFPGVPRIFPGAGNAPEQRPEGGGRPSASISLDQMLKAAQPTGGEPVRVESETSVTTIDGSKARLHFKDNSGEIEITSEDGKRVLTARDPEGKVIFTGPVNTEEERAAIPEEFRKKLSQIRVRPEASSTFSVAAASSGDGASTAPSAPRDEDFQ